MQVFTFLAVDLGNVNAVTSDHLEKRTATPPASKRVIMRPHDGLATGWAANEFSIHQRGTFVQMA